MKEIRVNYQQIINDYPDLMGRMMNELHFSRNDVVLDEIDFFYYWTIKQTESPMEEYKHMLKFEERLDYELSKVSIEIYLRFDTYIRGEITDNLEKPETVRQELSRLLVTTMRYEQSIYNNKMVVDSIPTDIEPFSEIEDLLDIKMLNPMDDIYVIDDGSDINMNKNLDDITLDDLLDKISQYGYDKLSEEEKDILHKLSKEE